MKKRILSIVMLLACTTAITANNSNKEIENFNLDYEAEDFSCTRTYTDSRGFTYTATAGDCETARRMLLIFIEAE